MLLGGTSGAQVAAALLDAARDACRQLGVELELRTAPSGVQSHVSVGPTAGRPTRRRGAPCAVSHGSVDAAPLWQNVYESPSTALEASQLAPRRHTAEEA